jgi:hypothetical protein
MKGMKDVFVSRERSICRQEVFECIGEKMVSCSRLGGVVEEAQYLEYLGGRRLQISIFRDFFVATWFFVVRRMLKGQIEDGYCSVIIIQFLGRSGNGESRYGGLNFRFW